MSDYEAPTVIKCRMAFLPEDFKVWAERIRENNPNNNIVVIPYDAEYVSGDIIKQCDVVDCCEDCPRYADDCDGIDEDDDECM